MEKDIEILEEILNRQIEDTEGTKIMKQAIENLINRVKELDNKDKMCGDAIDEATMLKQIKNKLKEENIPIETLIGELNRLEDLEDNTDELKIRIKELEEKYKRLSIEAQATAFDDENKDTEGLMRVLLKQGEIVLDENGYYKRQDFDWEENMFMLGLMKKREKTFYIPDDECLDEYTKQLESQLKEYNEIKEIFKKYLCFPNDTMYDGCCKMQDEIDELKEKVKELEKYEEYYKDMEEVNKKFIAVDKIKEKIKEVDKYGDCEIGSPPLYKTKKGIEIMKEDAELILQELLEE